jgi:hypothetical protein
VTAMHRIDAPPQLEVSYVLPLRAAEPRNDLTGYLRWLSNHVDVIVVDGSDRDVFDVHASWWSEWLMHVPVEPERRTAMGKVGGVLTGLGLARHRAVVVADDDVRYSLPALIRMEQLLRDAEVVRPQNVFSDWSWHTWWDTGRTLLARIAGGDWPGTLGLQREALGPEGYAGDVMFENLELVRTVQARGGREHVALDVVVPRQPPTVRQFTEQRVRQAYDEFARPARLVLALAVLPAIIIGRRRAVFAIGALSVVLAEIGRRRAGGAGHYPAVTTLAAPCWVAERAVTSWVAVVSRLLFGGVRYHGQVLARAATPPRGIDRR